MSSIVQALSYGAYEDFIELVATGREMSDADVREIAEGIVWTGADAGEIGLVDQLGGLNEAVASAAALAGVEEWRTGRTQLPPHLKTPARGIESLSMRAFCLPEDGSTLWRRVSSRSLKGCRRLRDPMHVYVQCLSCAPIL